MSFHHGVQRYIDRSLRVAHPESIHTIPDNFIFSQNLLDTDSRVTPNSLFEHQLDDTSVFMTPQEKIVSMRKRNGKIAESPEYLQGRLAYLREINKLVNTAREFDSFVDQQDIFPNGPFRNAIYAKYLAGQERIADAQLQEGMYLERNAGRAI